MDTAWALKSPFSSPSTSCPMPGPSNFLLLPALCLRVYPHMWPPGLPFFLQFPHVNEQWLFSLLSTSQTGTFSTLRACSSFLSRLKVKPRAHQPLSITPYPKFITRSWKQTGLYLAWHHPLQHSLQLVHQPRKQMETVQSHMCVCVGGRLEKNRLTTPWSLVLVPILASNPVSQFKPFSSILPLEKQTGTSSLQRTYFGWNKRRSLRASSWAGSVSKSSVHRWLMGNAPHHSVLPSFVQNVCTGLEGPCSDLTNALANVGAGSFGPLYEATNSFK